MSLITAMIHAAINNTPEGYLSQVLNSRTRGHKEASGSTFDIDQTEDTLLEAAEQAEPYTPQPGTTLPFCLYFLIPLPGKLGMVELSELPATDEVCLEDPKDSVGTDGGGVDAMYKGTIGNSVEFSVICLGPMQDLGPEIDDPGKLCMWTIHPGHTSIRVESANDPKLVGQTISVQEAMELGFTHAKLR